MSEDVQTARGVLTFVIKDWELLLSSPESQMVSPHRAYCLHNLTRSTRHGSYILYVLLTWMTFDNITGD